MAYRPISRPGAGRIRLYAPPSRSDRTVVVTIGVITIVVAAAGVALLSPAAYFAVFFVMSGLPVLTAQDTAGRPVSVLLREPAQRVPLAPPKLYALADAVLAAGRQDPGGWEVAGNLRALAGASPIAAPGGQPR